MNKLLTIVFNSYYSEKRLKNVVKNLKHFNIIIIENSLQNNVKLKFEKKYSNVKVIIPKKNLGLAAGYNLGIKKAKTKFVFLNNPDIEISHSSIMKLLNYAKIIKKFGIISPVYKNQKYHKNYGGNKNFLLKNNVLIVDWIDNNFLIDKSKIKKFLFDENYFLYFETIDFCLNLKRKGKNLYIIKNIKFEHFGSKSVDSKYDDVVKLTRAWHYNWSKFYYFKKNFNYIYAITKILPNIYQATRNLITNLFFFKFVCFRLNFVELYGIFSAVIGLKSFYRAKK